MRCALTDLYLRNLLSEERRVEVVDTRFRGRGSLVFRVTSLGVKSFAFRYRNLAGQSKRYTLGPYPAITLAEARKQALTLSASVALGKDPMEDKYAAKEAARDSLSFEELAEFYLRDHAARHKSVKSQAEDKRNINRDLLPAWRSRDIQSISRANVTQLLDAIVDRGAPVMANRVHALVSKMFSFALEKSYLSEGCPSPCLGVKSPGGAEKSRDRVLNEDEIRKLWKALEELSEPVASIYRLILLTGQRGGEVKALRWDEIDADVWTIPSEGTKNGRTHKVPLSPFALEVLAGVTDASEWVFPARVGHRPVQNLHLANQMIRAAGGFHFQPHDLRRTAATMMSKRSVDDVTIARILNHSWPDRNVTSVYNRWEKLPEMRRALERWAAELQRILKQTPAKVMGI